MAVEIRPIEPTRGELKKFVNFGIDHYKGNDCFIPPLVMDDVNTLSPSVNPAFDFCEAQSFMAYRDGKPVGRITGIINSAVNGRTGRKDARFGFVEFIDDTEVSEALFNAVAEWGRSKGMDSLVGPLGFTDMDKEGMLIEGFDREGTMATIYNYPYYPAHMEKLGFTPDADWVEYTINIPKEIPEKHKRIAEIAMKRNGLKIKKFTSRKKIKEEYGKALFELVNEAYDKLYGYSPLTPRQIDYYIDMYLGIINLNYVTVVVDENDKLVALGIAIQSFSKALKKSRGKLFPFGWWHLLKTLKWGSDVVDLLLIAVKPELQNKGVNAILFADLIPSFNKGGFLRAESNPELAANEKVQNQWDYFDHQLHKRRRSFRKSI